MSPSGMMPLLRKLSAFRDDPAGRPAENEAWRLFATSKPLSSALAPAVSTSIHELEAADAPSFIELWRLR